AWARSRRPSRYRALLRPCSFPPYRTPPAEVAHRRCAAKAAFSSIGGCQDAMLPCTARRSNLDTLIRAKLAARDPQLGGVGARSAIPSRQALRRQKRTALTIPHGIELAFLVLQPLLRSDDLHTIASRLLGGIERTIGAVEKRPDVASDVVVRRDADAHGAAHRHTVDERGSVGEGGAHALGLGGGDAELGAGHDVGELLAAEAAHGAVGIELVD